MTIEQTHPNFAAEWHRRDSILYRAPVALLDRMEAGEITRNQVAVQTRALFVQCKSGREWPIPKPFPLSFNPNAINPLELETDIKPWQHDLMSAAIASGFGDWLTALVSAGWHPQAQYEEGCPGLMGWAITHLPAEKCVLLKEVFDRQDWPIDLSSPAEVIEGKLPAKHVRRQFPNSLFNAVDQGDVEKITLLLAWGVDPYATGKNSGTLMERVISPNQTRGIKADMLGALATHGVITIRPTLAVENFTGSEIPVLRCVDHRKNQTDFVGYPIGSKLEEWHATQSARFASLFVEEHRHQQGELTDGHSHLSLTVGDMKLLYGIGLLSEVCHHTVWHRHEQALFELYCQLPPPIAQSIEVSARDVLIRAAGLYEVHTPLAYEGTLMPTKQQGKG